MKRMLAVMALALVPVLAQPPRLQGQCNEACVRIEMPEGRGYGCIAMNDTGTACIARSTGCTVKLCYNAMVTDPSGQMLAVADVCQDEVTVRPVRRGPASRSAARPRAPTRSAAVASASVGAAVRVG
jgi:hypothetical protein